ncbi:MAG: DUF3048 domain-containing protein [Actinomycetota bacterium]
MALTTRGKTLIGVAVVVVLLAAAALGYYLLTGGETPFGIGGGVGRPQTCPLTGLERPGGRSIPERSALAVKIENISVSRPQIGLEAADIVYEQPVEGGITRFIVMFQCSDAERLGPVRSVRESDPQVLVQFGSPLFGYSGGVPEVKQAVRAAGLIDVGFDEAPDAYTLDPNREAPHDVYTTTRALYRAGRGGRDVPEPIFTYDEDVPEGARRGRRVHADFSPESDVFWRYQRGQGRYLRFHGSEPHTLEDGTQVSATNVVVQVVQVRLTGRLDPAGNPVPEPVIIGRGQAFVFRNGRAIRGQWIRQSRDDITRFEDRQGNEIPLAPGTTWVQLFPRERFEEDRFEFS